MEGSAADGGRAEDVQLAADDEDTLSLPKAKEESKAADAFEETDGDEGGDAAGDVGADGDEKTLLTVLEGDAVARLEAVAAKLEARLDARMEKDLREAEAELEAEVEEGSHLLYENSVGSYYFRVQAMVLFEETIFPRAVFHFLICILSTGLQIYAIQMVYLTVWLFNNYSQYPDWVLEEYAGRELELPHAWTQGYHHNETEIHGVLRTIVLQLIFCGASIVLHSQEERDQLRAGYLLCLAEYKRRVSLDDFLVKRHGARVAMCCVIHLCRMSLLWYFYLNCALLLGVADGPLEMLLNSVALIFVLEFDDVLKMDRSIFRHVFGAKASACAKPLEVARTILRDVDEALGRCSPPRVRARKISAWLSAVGLFVCVVVIAHRLQRYTGDGKFVSADDDTAPTKHPELSHLYNWLSYGILLALLIDLHASGGGLGHNDDASPALTASTRRLHGFHGKAPAHWRHLLRFVFEVFLLIFIRVIVIEWFMDHIITTGRSHKTNPLHLWKAVDPRPNRPGRWEFDYEYADSADYDATHYDAG